MSRRPAPGGLAFGLALLLALAVMSAAAPLLSSFDPTAADPGRILRPPDLVHIAGTDEVGRDLFARILHGGRLSLSVAFIIVAVGAGAGVLIGAACGLIGGWLDQAAMRLLELFMALPGLVIALALSVALGPDMMTLAVVLGLLGAPFYAKIARDQTLFVRNQAFVSAARISGASPGFIVTRHILPNLADRMIVIASVNLSGALLAASGLSFLGLGAQPPTPEWGALVAGARPYLLEAWWYAVFPGLALMVSALSFTLIGDGLRDRLDPKDRSQ